MDIKNNEYLTQLYGFYGILLTNVQQRYFTDYYFDDLSLSEIAENSGVSRAAVYDSILRTTKLLQNYEQKLRLAKTYQSLTQVLTETQVAFERQDEQLVGQKLAEIKRLIEEY